MKSSYPKKIGGGRQVDLQYLVILAALKTVCHIGNDYVLSPQVVSPVVRSQAVTSEAIFQWPRKAKDIFTNTS